MNPMHWSTDAWQNAAILLVYLNLLLHKFSIRHDRDETKD